MTEETESPPNTNEDWETTTLIYEGGGEVQSSYQRFEKATDAFHSLVVEESLREKITFPVEVATIEMQLLATQTAIFAQPELLQPHQYRFWSLPVEGKEKPPRLKIVFLYHSRNGLGLDHDFDDDYYPHSVLVSLASTYPITFPPQDNAPWLKWLNERARQILTEQSTSYSVCDFMDHYALDYFNFVQLQEQGYSLILFAQPATWHGTHLVDSIVLDPLSITHDALFMRHNANGARASTTISALWPGASLKKDRSVSFNSSKSYWLHPCILDHKKWFKRECPVCYDDYLSEEMVNLDCGHYVCDDCFRMYAATQVNDIQQYRRENPFRCPLVECRRGIRIMGTVKRYLSASDMDRVRIWIKDLKHPVSKIFPNCLDCGTEEVMRKKEIDGFLVYCDKCKVKRCEYCVSKIKNELIEHLATKCQGAETLRFARRYLRASPELQAECEAKYPWIKIYAEARVTSALAIKEWLGSQQGQICPSCSHGVVREVGCFHIHCQCGTHFCYECGEELFPPFYGTHHCWEKDR